jgi:hypothetical protein
MSEFTHSFGMVRLGTRKDNFRVFGYEILLAHLIHCPLSVSTAFQTGPFLFKKLFKEASDVSRGPGSTTAFPPPLLD